MATFNNGESGLSVRNKLNEIINKVEGVTSINNNIDVTGTVTADGLTVDGKAEVNGVGSTTGIQLDNGAQAHKWYLVDNFTNRWDINTSSLGAIYNFGSNNGARNHLQITTGGDISFYEDTGTTAKFFWDASAESLGIGTTSPTTPLAVHSDAGVVIKIDGDTANTSRTLLFRSVGTGEGIVQTDGNMHFLQEDASRYMRFSTANTERMRIDSSGNLLISGTNTTPNTNSAGTTADNEMALRNDGLALFSAYKSTANDGVVMDINRTSTDGGILGFRKDGTTVGSIGTVGGSSYIEGVSGTCGIGFAQSGGQPWLNPIQGGSDADATVNLGRSAQRFKDLYLSGGVYLGGTGAANKLDDYEEGTWTPTSGNSGTLTFTRAYYTKIGNKVTLQIENMILSDTTSATSIAITSLPFASGVVSATGPIMASFRDNTDAITAFIPQSANEIRFYLNSGTISYQRMRHDMFNNSAGSIYMTITYFTT
jgi:hypothetical protein